MPSGSGPFSTKDYAPLADEVNPPFGNVAPAPTVSRNGTIVYSKRISRHSGRHSGTSTPSSEDDSHHGHRFSYASRSRSGSEDTLTGRRDRKGKGRASQIVEDEDGDIGSRSAHHMTYDSGGSGTSWARGGGYIPAGDGNTDADAEGSSYPPVNESESEEKRIQANLAKFAARDQARRKAARNSKILGSPVNSRPNSMISSSSSGSHARSPLSPLPSISESKRSSVLGFMRGHGGSKDKLDDEVPLSPVTAQTHEQMDPANPYEPTHKQSGSGGSIPSMSGSSPFVDPSSLNGSGNGNRTSAQEAAPPADGFGYVGPGWRGGQAHIEEAPPRKERWWHSLCAWGADLDGGDSKQAGRTNPME